MDEHGRVDSGPDLNDGLAGAIVATVREPLVVLDGDLRVRTANRSFYRTFRVTPAETEGRLVYDLGDRQWDIPGLRTLLEEILPRDAAFNDFEVAHDFPGVGRKVMLLNARRLRQPAGHAELILLAIEDVTALREADRAKREAESRFTEMVKNVRDHSIFLTDPDGVITSWNVAAERIIGYPAAEAVGRHLSLIFTPDDVAAGTPELELRQAREAGRAEDERWHRRKDGGLFWAQGIVTPLHDPDGRLSGYSKILRDMTAWKRADEDRRRSALLVENSTDFIGMCDLDGRPFYVNPAGLRMVGLGDVDQARRTPVAEFFFPEDRAFITGEFLPRVLRDGRGEIEARFRHFETGEAVWVVYAVTVLRDDGGRPTGLATISRNVTDYMRAERQLAASRARLQAVFDTTQDALLLADDDARYADANPAACTLLGYDRDELLRRRVFDVTPAANGDAGRAAWAAFVRDGRQQGEYEVRRRDGSIAVVEYRAVANVQPGLHLSALRDVTGRRQTVEALRASERRFKTLAGSAPVGIFETDAAGHCLFVNDRWCAMAGVPAAAAAGRGWADALHPDDRDRVFAEWYAAAGAGREFAAEYRFRSPAGVVTWVAGRGVAVRDDAGAVAGYIGTVADITSLKEAEERARRRAEEVETLMEVMPVAVWLALDPDCRRVTGNRAGAAMLRMPAGANLSKSAPAGERPTHFRVTRGGREVPAAELPLQLAAARGAEVRGVEEEITFDDGAVVHAYGSTSPLFDDAGAVRGAVAAFLDVSDLRRAEAAVRETAGRLRALSDNLPDGAVYQTLATPGGGRRFAFISAGVERLFGVTAAEATADAAALYGLVHAADRARLAAAEEAALRDSAPFDCEFRSWTRSGELRWVHCRSAPRRLPSGETVWEGIVLDATARKQAEADLARVTAESDRRRRLYETILANTPDPAYVFDLGHRFTYANEILLRMWGKTWDEAIGRNCLELGYEPWHAEMHDREIERVKATKQPIRGEVPFAGTFGRRIYDYIFVPVLGPGGEVEAVAGTTRDVTDRKAMEDELRRTAAELSEAGRRKDDFLATLAHELRNPLAPLRNGLRVLRLAGDDPAAVERSLAMMDRQLAQMVRLIDDLLDVSRITRGKLRLRRERVELAAVVQAAVEGSRPQIDAAGHHLTVALPPAPVPLDADPARLAQVFSNLLTNAAKYTDRGGRIAVTAERHGGRVAVSVADDGIGIPADRLPGLFQMFSQVDSALERSQGGLGIGLSLVKGLAEMHGGAVEARSDGPGRGSAFTVWLPVAGDAAAEPVPPADRGAAAGPRRRILVADDNRDAADSLAEMLQLAGHEVRVAYDGRAAVEAAGAFRPDVALLDIGMPGLNGYEAARGIRGQPGGRGVTLVALTGWGQEEDKRRAAEAGFDHHATKPVDPAVLDRLLASAPARPA